MRKTTITLPTLILFIFFGCDLMQVEEDRSPTAFDLEQQENEVIQYQLVDRHLSADLAVLYQSVELSQPALARSAGDVEFNFDSTAMYEVQEEVFALFTPEKGAEKEFFLLSSLQDEALSASQLVFKYDAANETSGVLTAYTFSGELFGVMEFHDNELVSSITYLEGSDYNTILEWWEDFGNCISDPLVTGIIYVGTVIGGPAFGTGAMAGALIGCAQVATFLLF